MWIERSERREVGEQRPVRRRHVPAAAADRVRRGRLRGRAVPARARHRLAAVRGRPARALRQPERFPDAEEVVAAWPEEAFAQLGGIDRATAIAVLTHDPKLDDAALIIALRSEAGYIGAMGSRRAQESRRERLLAKGVTDEEPARISAPIGLDLGALTAGGDRALDHGRDRRDALRPRGRPARARQGPHPRGRRVRRARRRLVLAAGGGWRFGGTKQLAPLGGVRCSSYAVESCAVPASPVRGRARPRARGDPRRRSSSTAPRRRRLRGLARGPVRVAAAGIAALGEGERRSSCSATSRSSREVVAAALDRRARPTRCAPPTAARPGHPVLLSRALLERAGGLRGDVGSVTCWGSAGPQVEAGHLWIRRTSTRGRSWRGDEARAVIRGAGADGAGLGGADRPRAGRPCLPGARSRATTRRHLPRRVQGQARPDDRVLPRHGQDRGGRRGDPHARR